MTTRTFKQLREFNIMAQSYLMRCGTDTKLAYAIERVQESNLKNVFKEYSEKLRDIRIENCFTDKDGVIQYDILKEAGGRETRDFKYTKEGLRAKEKEEKELIEDYDKKDVEFEPFIATEVPLNLGEMEIQLFRGIVIPENYVKTPLVVEDQNGMGEEPVLKEKS